MEQKAVTYKTIKGMARDMAMSSGSNDFSYENYNIRITTRGKEDSLIVTNEKGTESNIIATRSVNKTVNTVFIGKQADFFQNMAEIQDASDRFNYPYTELYRIPLTNVNDLDMNYMSVTEKEYVTGKDDDGNDITFYRQDITKTNAILSSSNDDITFGINTEYPVNDSETLNNEIKVKGTFIIDEEPTEYMNDNYYLIDNGYFEKEIELIIPANYNNCLERISVKDIVLNKCSNVTNEGYYKGATDIDDIDDANINYSVLTDEIMSSWMTNYKYLYDILIQRKFNFFGFSTNMFNYTSTSSDKLEKLYQNIINNSNEYLTGRYAQSEFYSNVGELVENKTTDAGVDLEEGDTGYDEATNWRVSTTINRLGFLNGPILSDKYPNQTSMSLRQQATYTLRYPIFRLFTDEEWNSNEHDNDYVFKEWVKYYAGTVADLRSKGKSGCYKCVGYVKYEFNVDVTSTSKYFDNSQHNIYATYKGEVSTDNNYTAKFSSTQLYLSFGPYSTSSYSPCFALNLKGVTENSGYSLANYGGPFYPKNITTSDFKVGPTTIETLGTNDVPNVNIGSYIAFIYTPAQSNTVTIHTFNDIYPYENFDGTTISKTDTNSVVVKTTDGVVFTKNSDTSTLYSCLDYSILSVSNNFTSINSITSKKETGGSKNIYIDFGSTYNIIYNTDTNVLTYNGVQYVALKITSSDFDIPFNVYLAKSDYDALINTNTSDGYSNGKIVYAFTGTTNGFVQITSQLPAILNKDFTERKVPCSLASGATYKVFKDSTGKLFFGSSASVLMSGESVNIERLNELPIYFTGDNTTKIKSDFRELYTNPTYDRILNYFGFKQDKFKASFTIDKTRFRVKQSNSNWDEKYKYEILDDVNDNLNYIQEIYPYYVFDNKKVYIEVTQTNDNLIDKVYVKCENATKSNDVFYNSTITDSNIYITIVDKKDKTISYKDTLYNFEQGINANTIKADLNLELFNKHDFYISEINSYNSEPSGLKETNIKQEVVTKETDEEKKEYNKIEYKTLSATISDVKHNYLRQIYTDNDGFITTSTIEYDFLNQANYKNTFYSMLDLTLEISSFGDYQALTIPGRILGSCTIDDYVVLFFHYSSPALKYYKKISENNYQLVINNTSEINELYTKRVGSKNVYDLAVKNGELLRDDNNDYINGKNKDYIVRLKYINAKPDNKENEWVDIVNNIANAATQVHLTTPITEKKPYYAADILWAGDLKFNANNGIETIGYYESKDVIKVYFTDGRNQPRMINIMTPKELRNGVDCVWDDKTFDFIQEIKGEENYEITKQFGGGAFPAGSVQYYFTYTNLGGCETNPFIYTPIYYTSQSSKGNAPTKITDNTFKIKLTNLSKRFDYVNIYSIVRTTKDMQPLCKRIINLSINKSDSSPVIEFTDNNLLGEIIDSTYLLMLQGTPISALTMDEKDNTLFLGNINKLQKNLSNEDKANLRNMFSVYQGLRDYQDYNPNDEDWYENLVKDGKISLESNSSEIKTFMYNEYYRLGIQFQDKFGKWSDPVFITDIQCNKTINNYIHYSKSTDDDDTTTVNRLRTQIPYFYLKINNGKISDFNDLINRYEYKRIRPVIVYPNISSRNVLCQGLLSPTMFNYADRSVNGPFNFASYYFRPYPPAISDNKTESGDYVFNVNPDIEKVGGYPIEYRHGYPINGYHDAVEESLANGDKIGSGTVGDLVSNYLSSKPTTFVKLTSNTPGWNIPGIDIRGKSYLREGTINISNPSHIVTVSYSGKIYRVSELTNKGHLKYDSTSNDTYTIPCSGVSRENFKKNEIDQVIQFNPFGAETRYNVKFGFSSHMHYFKNKVLYVLSQATIGQTVDALYGYPTDEIIKKIGDTDCAIDADGLIFNEQGVIYKAYYPVTIKILPLSKIRKVRHRGIKRKTYYCDIIVSADRIEMASSKKGDKYVDDGDASAEVAKKAYFAYNNGEIACANGNKNYNIFEGSVVNKVDETYDSSEINVSSRKQSLFYVDESVCTLNSPEIEHDPTVQKIDLSTYKLNIVGAANITGYKNNLQIDTETPPAAFGTIVGQGFRHESFEIQNFNTEAYRYMLSGAYWYDAFFQEGTDEEGEKYVDDSKYVSDQYCWWVYPFNRQILNNSREGQYGKLRTKKWVNYHYSAFNDYFGDEASINYNLLDAKQIYDVHQTENLNTLWQKDACTYFGSVDTAYTNPVPLVGVLGGSNDPDENAYEQSLAVSPHCGFKAGSDTYSSANLADIVPFSFNSSNHFVLSLDRFESTIGKSTNVFPKYYTDETLLSKIKETGISSNFETRYQLIDSVSGIEYFTDINPLEFLNTGRSDKQFVISDEDASNPNYLTFIKLFINPASNLFENLSITLNNVVYNFPANLISLSEAMGECGITIEEGDITSVKFRKVKKYENGHILYDYDFDDVTDNHCEETYKIRTRGYNIPSSLILDSTKPDSCVEKYVKYEENNFTKQNGDTVKTTGIYDYGHVYIAQLERGVKNADEVFNGTSESVLLQNTWIPAGEAVSINKFISNSIKYTEGDTYYQRYDCMKTYAHNSQDVNQNIEVLSTMIQTRINLDGVYSYRGTVDNVDMNNTNTNLLNTAYTQDNNYFTYSITNSYINDITEYSNMFTWTLTKQPMSSTDNWLAINLIAYYNATGSFGKITRIINYRNSLFCFQNDAISQIAYNERVALTPSDGVPIEIGNSGKVQGLNYISSNVGCQNRWSVCSSKGYLYWVDDRRAEIYRFGEGLEPFSTVNGFSDWVKANTYGEDWKPIKSTNVPITTYYDNNNDDIYFVTEKDCLAYNEKLNAFESFFSYEDSFILNSAGNTIVIKEQDSVIKENSDIFIGDSWWNNGIRGDGLSSIELMHEGQYNRFFGVQMPFYMRFKVYPSDLQRDKIYTNLEFNLDAFDEKDLYLPDETITKVRIWNEYQWGQWKLNDPLYGTTAYKRRFRTHYLQLPRASYYPTDYYENFNIMFYREPMWNVWNNSITSGNVLSYINASSINDRIRNPWTWLEIYKSNGTDANDFKIAVIEGVTFAQKQQYYLNNKSKLFIQKYVQVSKDEWGNYQELYKIVNYEYVKEANDGSDRQPLVISVPYVDRNEYDLSELYYIKQDGTYDNASQDMYDNEDIILYKLSFNELYALNYINCANIFKFADDVTYYELKKSNCRVEIHDIILKYFEA